MLTSNLDFSTGNYPVSKLSLCFAGILILFFFFFFKLMIYNGNHRLSCEGSVPLAVVLFDGQSLTERP